MKRKERTLNILNELVKNSLDANSTDINVNIKNTTEYLEITVQDNGDGFDEQTLEKAEKRLNQKHRSIYDEYYSGLAGKQQAGSGLKLIGFQIDEYDIKTSSEGTTVWVKREENSKR